MKAKKNLKKYGKLWSKNRDLIKSVTRKSDYYDVKYMKTRFDSDENLPLNKTIEIFIITILVRVIFHKNNKYYPQVLSWMSM